MPKRQWAGGTCNREDLISDIRERSKLTEQQSRGALEAVLESIINALQAGERVEIRGFGVFNIREARDGERPWVNPRDGKTYKLFGSKGVSFKVSRVLRGRLNHKRSQ